MNFKQCLLSINTQLGICWRPPGGCPRAVSPRQMRGARELGSVLTDKSVPVRRAPSLQIATATFVLAPLGMAAREAAPGTVCADRSAASAAAGGLVAYYQNPWQEGGNELSPPLPQPPHSQQSLWMARLCILRCTKFLSNDDLFPQAAYVFHTGRPFFLSFLNIWPSEELRTTS